DATASSLPVRRRQCRLGCARFGCAWLLPIPTPKVQRFISSAKGRLPDSVAFLGGIVPGLAATQRCCHRRRALCSQAIKKSGPEPPFLTGQGTDKCDACRYSRA